MRRISSSSTVGHVLARLRADAHGVLRLDADDLLDLLDHPVRVGGRQVDLVDDRHDFETLLDRGVAVRDALRLDALRRIDDEQRAFARGERARHFVGEVDVARRVDQIELIGLAVLRVGSAARRSAP